MFVKFINLEFCYVTHFRVWLSPQSAYDIFILMIQSTLNMSFGVVWYSLSLPAHILQISFCDVINPVPVIPFGIILLDTSCAPTQKHKTRMSIFYGMFCALTYMGASQFRQSSYFMCITIPLGQIVILLPLNIQVAPLKYRPHRRNICLSLIIHDWIEWSVSFSDPVLLRYGHSFLWDVIAHPSPNLMDI